MTCAALHDAEAWCGGESPDDARTGAAHHRTELEVAFVDRGELRCDRRGYGHRIAFLRLRHEQHMRRLVGVHAVQRIEIELQSEPGARRQLRRGTAEAGG